MSRNVKQWWINGLFGPRNKGLFRLRIRARVQKARFRIWWRRPKAAVFRHHWRKPAALLLVGVAAPILTGWLLSRLFPEEARGLSAAVHNLLTDPAQSRLEWREAAQILLLLIGVPAAFLLWLFRDINVSGTLDNQRKDVNLKEFQEIQMRAAGAMDEKLPAPGRETLQIAALHQLRAFLRGEYGKSFRRPALELLRARLVASGQATGIQDVHDWLRGWRAQIYHGEGMLAAPEQMKREIDTLLDAVRESSVAKTEHVILSEEWEAIFRSGLPVSSSRFDRLDLSPKMLLSDVDLLGCTFVGSLMMYAHFEGANLFRADLARARAMGAHFEFADLTFAKLEGAILRHAQLQHIKADSAQFRGADLTWARLDGAFLDRASFHSADLAHCRLDRAMLRRARFHGAVLSQAVLTGADLYQAEFPNANLRLADLRNADLTGANVDEAIFEGARLGGATIAGPKPDMLASCEGAEFDSETRFAENWAALPEEQKDALRAQWIERGAKLVGASPAH